ncbi:hypothetical protein ABZ297_27625 [Nonomuraea sp. NPDC005983]|uniref:hypothetical protein n=1 Tax=Nonomuraea sp. NPDC005983 TaxID=3155595 RepID=UPI0033A3DC4B
MAATAGAHPLRVAAGALAAIGVLLPPSPAAGALGLTVLPVTYYVLLTVVAALYGGALLALTHWTDRRTNLDLSPVRVTPALSPAGRP